MRQSEPQFERMDHLQSEIRHACRAQSVNWSRVLRLAEEVEAITLQRGEPCPVDMAMIRRRVSF